MKIINVASALSSFFNHELYRPKGQHLGELQ
jgi:hypothetical protein